VPVTSRYRGAVVLSAFVLVGTGCASAERPHVERVALTFDNPSADPRARCDLLLPTAREQLEQDAGTPCPEAIGGLPPEGGEVSRTEVWGGGAQVRIGGDTVFLARTAAGWRIAAAGCTARRVGPYDCEVDAS
jgi:hypothetical protein